MQPAILELAGQETAWREFLAYKITHQNLHKKEERILCSFIDRQAYLPLCQAWAEQRFPSSLPVKYIINKSGSSKKRIVYSFPGDEGLFLKFIAFHLYRYDYRFAGNCYAFRRSVGVRDAILRIRLIPSLGEYYCLKLDISNYFNSIDVEKLIEKLGFLEKEEPSLYQLFLGILRENRVLDGSASECCPENILTESHGAMAGTPVSPFFANIYLSELDWFFAKKNLLYFRYSDDILVFARDEKILKEMGAILYEKITALGLSLNPDKIAVAAPGDTWEFLGFSYVNGRIDLSENTIRKMKAKISRKADALRRWQRKKNLTPDKAAIGLIRAMNRKFYGDTDTHVNTRVNTCVSTWEETEEENDPKTYCNEFSDFTWSRWFFPNLNTDRGLKELDMYFQEYIRYTVTGRHYKGNYRISYRQLKEWGYRSLVHEYYAGSQCAPRRNKTTC